MHEHAVDEEALDAILMRLRQSARMSPPLRSILKQLSRMTTREHEQLIDLFNEQLIVPSTPSTVGAGAESSDKVLTR